MRQKALQWRVDSGGGARAVRAATSAPLVRAGAKGDENPAGL